MRLRFLILYLAIVLYEPSILAQSISNISTAQCGQFLKEFIAWASTLKPWNPSELIAWTAARQGLEPTRVLPAAKIVVLRRLRMGDPHILRLSYDAATYWTPEIDANFGQWLVKIFAATNLPNYRTDTTPVGKGFKFGDDSVQEVRIRGIVKYFRPIDGDMGSDGLGVSRATGVRAAANAYKILHEFFPSSHHIPASEIAIVNGVRGLLMDDVGGKLEKSFDLKDATPDSVSFAKAFQFLIGNYDISPKQNKGLALTPQGELRNFDPDGAFGIGIEEDNGAGRMGAILPDYYTKEFVDGLDSLITGLEQKMGEDLNPSEKYYLLLRADIIRADIKRRFE